MSEKVTASILPQAVVEAALEDAAQACGLLREDGRHAVAATIRSGLKRALSNPREVSL